MGDAACKRRTNECPGVSRILHAVKVQRVRGKRFMRPVKRRNRDFKRKARAVLHRRNRVVKRGRNHKRAHAPPLGNRLSVAHGFGRNTPVSQKDAFHRKVPLEDDAREVRAFGERKARFARCAGAFHDLFPAAVAVVGRRSNGNGLHESACSG